MIEVAIVRSMVRRGLLLSPVAVAVLALLGGTAWAASGAAGLALTLVNLWVAGRVIGGLAENRPDLLLAAAVLAMLVGLGVVGAGLVAVSRVDLLDVKVAGVSLSAAHLLLVGWEASDRFLRLPSGKGQGEAPPVATRRS